MRMKQAKIVFLSVFLILASVLVSCVPGGGQPVGGWAGTALDDGIIYAGTRDGRVVAVNESTRNLEWSYAVTMPSTGISCGPSVVSAAIYTTPIVEGELVYFGTYGTRGGRIYALSIADGNIIWEYPKGGAYIGAIVGRPAMEDEILYVTSSDSTVYALNTTRNGVKEWESEILNERDRRHERLWTSPVVHNGTVYVSTFDGDIYALSGKTGELSWSYESQAGFASSPVIHEDTIYAGSFDNNLYAVKIGDDEPLWKFPGDDWFWAAPVVSEGVVYAGCLDGKLYAIRAATGNKVGQYDADSPIVSSPVLANNLLVLADESGTVYVFDLSAEPGNLGVPLETITIDADVRGSFCVEEGLIYIRTEDAIYAVSIDEGWIEWEFDLTVEE
jgi:outer membrane protein assembly factor BamB